jgi:hypothetical protein
MASGVTVSSFRLEVKESLRGLGARHVTVVTAFAVPRETSLTPRARRLLAAGAIVVTGRPAVSTGEYSPAGIVRGEPLDA